MAFINGTVGDDTLIGTPEMDSIFGQRRNDYLSGEAGDDSLFGGFGNDTLIGGDGNDRLDGFGSPADIITELEVDTLKGGTGGDTFVLGTIGGVYYEGGFDPTTNTDASYAVITDFKGEEGDRIQLYTNENTISYGVGYANWAGDPLLQDTGIFLGNDLITIVQDKTTFTNQDFIFV